MTAFLADSVRASRGLLYFAQPLVRFKPLRVDTVVGAITFNLTQEVVQEVQEVRIATAHCPTQRFKGERLVKVSNLAWVLACVQCVERQVVNECIRLVVGYFQYAFCLSFEQVSD